jgi:hypothetical protein
MVPVPLYVIDDFRIGHCLKYLKNYRLDYNKFRMIFKGVGINDNDNNKLLVSVSSLLLMMIMMVYLMVMKIS